MVKISDVDNGESLYLYKKTQSYFGIIIVGLILVIILQLQNAIGKTGASFAIVLSVLASAGIAAWLYARVNLLAVKVSSSGVSNISTAILSDMTDMVE
jgi:hypothetical protein